MQIWHKIIKELNKAKLSYVMVGAAALVIHGFPRSTLDIDIYVPAKESILKKLFKITHALGLKGEQRAILKISHSPELFTGQWICFSCEGQDILDWIHLFNLWTGKHFLCCLQHIGFVIENKHLCWLR